MNLKKHIWKILFFLLLLVNLTGILYVSVRIFSGHEPKISASSNLTALATISSNRKQLNTLINSYLSAKNSDYKIELANDKQAVLQTSYSFLGQSIPISIDFAPTVQTDGSVKLDVKHVSAGNFDLPTNLVLSYISSNRKLPAFVQVKASENQIILHLSNLTIGQNLTVKAVKFDFDQDKFTFNLMKKA